MTLDLSNGFRKVAIHIFIKRVRDLTIGFSFDVMSTFSRAAKARPWPFLMEGYRVHDEISWNPNWAMEKPRLFRIYVRKYTT